MKAILVFLLSLSFWGISYAQLPKKRWLPQCSYHSSMPYLAVQSSAGVKKVKMTPTEFLLNYNHPFTDSLFPSQENIRASKFAGGRSTVLDLTLATEVGFTKGPFGEIRFDYAFAKPSLKSLEVGGGWNFELVYYENERIFTIRPALDFVWLANDIKIGSYTFPANVKSVAMVDAIFERRADLNFTLRNRAQGLKPRLSLSTPIGTRWWLRGDFGYLFILHKRSNFKITQENVNQAPYILSPNEPRLNFTMNAGLHKKDLFVYSGMFSQIGIARRFGDDRDNGRRYKNNKWR